MSMRVAPRGVLVVMIAVLAAWLLVGCRGSTHLISTEQERQIGQEAAAEFDREHSVSRSSPMALRLAEIGERVGQAASPPDYPYSFTLVNEDVDNAFALPGGPVYFYQGLINSLGNDEHQIAWVCAHEITHIRQQHAIRRIERAIGASLLIELALGEAQPRMSPGSWAACRFSTTAATTSTWQTSSAADGHTRPATTPPQPSRSCRSSRRYRARSRTTSRSCS